MNSVQKASEVWNEIEIYAVKKLNEIVGQAKTDQESGPAYVITLYKAASQKLKTYSVTETGLKSATAALASGDAVYLPACNISFSGNLNIPAGGAVVGLGRETSKISGQVTLGAGAALIDVGNIRSVNDALATYGIIGPGSGTAYLQNCKISATQAGAGTGYAMRLLGGAVESAGSQFFGTTAGGIWGGAGQWRSYHDRITAANPFVGGTSAGTYTFDADYQGWEKDSQGWNSPFTTHTLSIDTVTYHGGPGAIKIYSPGSGNITKTYTGPLLLYRDVSVVVHTNDTISLWAKCNSDYAGERVYIKVVYSDASTLIYDTDPNGSFNWTQHTLTIPAGDDGKTISRVYFGEYYDGWDLVYTSTWWFDDVYINGYLASYSPNVLVNGSSFEASPTGVPGWGDRAVYDAANYPAKHANDTDLSTTALHHTLGSGATQAAAGNHYHHLNKLDATTAPTVNDDAGDGYSINSIWIDATNDKAYICLDATVGAAVWKDITGLVSPMTAVGDMIVQGTSVTLNNTDQSGNKIISASPSNVGRIIASCDLQIPNPVGTISYIVNLWVSMNDVGKTKTVTVMIQRDDLNGAGLVQDTKTMTIDSALGHDQQITFDGVDSSPTTGRYVLAIYSVGQSTAAIYSDTRQFSISGISNVPARFPIGTEGQVHVVTSGAHGWKNASATPGANTIPIGDANGLLTPWVIPGDAPLENYGSVGDHFLTAGSYPTGWTEVDAPASTVVNSLRSYWSLVTSTSNLAWKYRKRLGFNIESFVPSASTINFLFGPIYFRDVDNNTDVVYKFGIYRDNAGAIDEQTYIRCVLKWNDASGIWQVFGEEKDGTVAHTGTARTISWPWYQGFYFKISIYNYSPPKTVRAYMGLAAISPAQQIILSQDPTTPPTFGQAWLQIEATRSAAGVVNDYLHIGSVDAFLG